MKNHIRVILILAVAVSLVIACAGVWFLRSIVEPNRVSIESADALGKALAPLIKSHYEQALKSPDFRVTVTCDFSGADIKHTDSAVHPMVAELVFVLTTMSEARLLMLYDQERHTLSLVKESGRWKIIEHKQVCDEHKSVPTDPSTAEQIGRARALDPALFQPLVDAASRGEQ